MVAQARVEVAIQVPSSRRGSPTFVGSTRWATTMCVSLWTTWTRWSSQLMPSGIRLRWRRRLPAVSPARAAHRRHRIGRPGQGRAAGTRRGCALPAQHGPPAGGRAHRGRSASLDLRDRPAQDPGCRPGALPGPQAQHHVAGRRSFVTRSAPRCFMPSRRKARCSRSTSTRARRMS